MQTLFTTEDDIERVGHGLLDRSLPKGDWTHAAHFAAVLWLLRQRPYTIVLIEMPGLIRAYNEATGVANTDTGGYHATITLASIRGAANALSLQPASRALYHIANDLMAGDLGRSDWLLQYWSRPLLFSVAARQYWVAPDRAPLPF